jgi:hypothetical protein
MTSQDSHPIRNGVLATVLGGVVLASLTYFWPFFKASLLWSWGKVIQLWGLFTDRYSLPGWAFLVMAILCLPTIVRVVFAFRRGSPNLPGYASYVEDIIHGARWRWHWVSNQISNLWCYCPRCDSELVYDDSSCRRHIYDVRKTDFICEHCGRSVVTSIAGGDKAYALSSVEREIRRKIRTGQAPLTSRVSQEFMQDER